MRGLRKGSRNLEGRVYQGKRDIVEKENSEKSYSVFGSLETRSGRTWQNCRYGCGWREGCKMRWDPVTDGTGEPWRELSRRVMGPGLHLGKRVLAAAGAGMQWTDRAL